MIGNKEFLILFLAIIFMFFISGNKAEKFTETEKIINPIKGNQNLFMYRLSSIRAREQADAIEMLNQDNALPASYAGKANDIIEKLRTTKKAILPEDLVILMTIEEAKSSYIPYILSLNPTSNNKVSISQEEEDNDGKAVSNTTNYLLSAEANKMLYLSRDNNNNVSLDTVKSSLGYKEYSKDSKTYRLLTIN